MRWKAPGRRPPDSGYATVEIALAIPSLVLLTLALAGILAGMATQIRCVDAARLGARAAARGEPPKEVESAVARAAPGSSVHITRENGLVHVSVAAPVAAVPMLRAFTVHAEAYEADEADEAGQPNGAAETSAEGDDAGGDIPHDNPEP